MRGRHPFFRRAEIDQLDPEVTSLSLTVKAAELGKTCEGMRCREVARTRGKHMFAAGRVCGKPHSEANARIRWSHLLRFECLGIPVPWLEG